MKINKLGGVVAVAAVLLCANVSSADEYLVQACPDTRDQLVYWIEEFARYTRCDGYPYPIDEKRGQWNQDDPVWQHRPKQGGNGCEVHWKLSKLLDDENTSGGGKRMGQNGNRGAANNLDDGKYFEAIDDISEYIATIEEVAVVRGDDVLDINGVEHLKDEHQHFADHFVDEAKNILSCIGELSY